MTRRRTLAPMALAFSLLLAALPRPAAAELRDSEPMNPETRGVAIVADILLARPFGLAATAIGATLYIVAFPFAAMSGDMTSPAETLVGEPARFTFTRPLGQIDSLH